MEDFYAFSKTCSNICKNHTYRGDGDADMKVEIEHKALNHKKKTRSSKDE